MTNREEFDTTHNVRTDGQIHLGPINLDDMPSIDLLVAETHPALHEDVREYATCKLEARTHRVKGNITLAQMLERRCDRLYKSMPKSCRW